MLLVEISEITQMVQKVFEEAGLCRKDANEITSVLHDAQMKGIYTHGYVRVKKYVDCIKAGGILPEGNIEVVCDMPSWALADGKGWGKSPGGLDAGQGWPSV